MSSPNSLSITTELDAITSGMRTDREGLEAFRLAGGEVARAMDELDEGTPLHHIAGRAIERASESDDVSKAKETHPDEFAIGAAIHAYKEKQARTKATERQAA